MTYLEEYNSLLGKLTLCSDGQYLTGLWFEGQKNFGSTIGEKTGERELFVFTMTKKWLDSYFGGKGPQFYPEIRFKDTEYNMSVWNALMQIPYGQTASYKEIAEAYEELTGKKTSPRAVGKAISKNPVAIIIPCHRVISSDGSLGGYNAGVDIKEKLLKLEKSDFYR